MIEREENLQDDVFATADTPEEAMLLRKIVLKHAPWPVVYENKVTTKFLVGGLKKNGSRLDKETVAEIIKEIEEYIGSTVNEEERKTVPAVVPEKIVTV